MSVGNISLQSNEELQNAIARVVESYDSNSRNEQVLVQEYFTGYPDERSRIYQGTLRTNNDYVINYDDENNSSDTVTGGHGSGLKTFYRWKHFDGKVTDPSMERIIRLLQRLESLTGIDGLDVEFAFWQRKTGLYFTPVRPIADKINKQLIPGDYSNYLLKIYKDSKLNLPHPDLYGSRRCWESCLIGTRRDYRNKTRMLALSIYKELITDSIWAYQRNNYGYKISVVFHCSFLYSVSHI